MTDSFSYDVFLSYNSKDKTKVLALAERLRNKGLHVWLDDWVIKPGDDISLAIESGLQESRTQILCLSQTALDSEWGKLERSTVLFRDATNRGRRFVPLLLSDCNLPDTLRRYKFVDYRDQSTLSFEVLLSACRTSFGNASVTSSPQYKKDIATLNHIVMSNPDVLSKPDEDSEALWINALSVSPDSKWFATGNGLNDEGGVIEIWNLETGKSKMTFQGHSKAIQSLVFSQDGLTLFSSSKDKTIKKWQLGEDEPQAIFNGHSHSVMDLALSADDRTLFSCSANEGPPTWRAWSTIKNKEILRVLDTGNTCIHSLVISDDETKLISAGSDNNIKLWDIETKKCLSTLKGHSDAIRSVKVTKDGRVAVSGSRDKTIKVWNLDSGSCLGTLEGHTSSVRSVDISPDNRVIASAGFTDGNIRLWDLKSGECLQVINTEQANSPLSVAFSPNGAYLLVSTTEGSIFVYNVAKNYVKTHNRKTKKYVNAKVVLLGEGTVGKTSLAHRLVKDEYVIEDRTHGMNVWPINLPISTDNNIEREALLWDLAGQEDYRLIHQIFLEETALALLLVNPQNNDPFAETEDWLKALQTVSSGNDPKRKIAQLLIFSQTDVGGMKLSDSKVDQFCKRNGFKDWLATSAKNGDYCSDSLSDKNYSDLKQLITKNIPWNELPWTSTPRLLSELKNAVLAMSGGEDTRLLRFSELHQRLIQKLPEESFTEADVRTAVTLLCNHGLTRQLAFGDLVLLQPELVNGYAAAIIRAARAHTDEIGCVSVSEIYSPNFDFTGVKRLKRADEELLLRALVEIFLMHSLCISQATPQGVLLVFPSQYRREKDIPHEPNIFVSYTFSGEWQTVWTTLIVRLWYGNEFENPELWRNAVEFKSSKGSVLGLKIDNKQGSGKATISLYFHKNVADELKVIFIEYVHTHLNKHACDVTRIRRYVCASCDSPVTDFGVVRKRIKAKKDFITCQSCDEKIKFIDFIERRLKSDPVAKKILSMEEEATRKLDTQALEQILIGHMMAICGEANQIFRPVTMADHGIDGEVEFKDDSGDASGNKVYIQLKSGDSYLRRRKRDDKLVFDVKNKRHLTYWANQPVDVYLVIRYNDDITNEVSIRWMNITDYLKKRKNKHSKQIIFEGEQLDMSSVWSLRDQVCAPSSP